MTRTRVPNSLFAGSRSKGFQVAGMVYLFLVCFLVKAKKTKTPIIYTLGRSSEISDFCHLSATLEVPPHPNAPCSQTFRFAGQVQSKGKRTFGSAILLLRERKKYEQMVQIAFPKNLGGGVERCALNPKNRLWCWVICLQLRYGISICTDLFPFKMASFFRLPARPTSRKCNSS